MGVWWYGAHRFMYGWWSCAIEVEYFAEWNMYGKMDMEMETSVILGEVWWKVLLRIDYDSSTEVLDSLPCIGDARPGLDFLQHTACRSLEKLLTFLRCAVRDVPLAAMDVVRSPVVNTTTAPL
jgi:hypothetical protein